MSNVEVQIRLRAAGIVSYVLQLLDSFYNEPKIVSRLIRLVCSLAQDHINREDLVNAGACEKIVDVASLHFTDNDIIREFALTFVAFMESNSGKTRITNRLHIKLNKDQLALFVNALDIISNNCDYD